MVFIRTSWQFTLVSAGALMAALAIEFGFVGMVAHDISHTMSWDGDSSSSWQAVHILTIRSPDDFPPPAIEEGFDFESGPNVDPEQCRLPEFPEAARHIGVRSEVWVELLVSVTGKVKNAVVKKSSGNPMLDDAALGGLRRCHFFPARTRPSTGSHPFETSQEFIYIWDPSCDHAARDMDLLLIACGRYYPPSSRLPK